MVKITPMINIWNKLHISNYTYLFILLAFLSGYIKNILFIYFIVLIHELGHIFFILLFNYKIDEVILMPFGGYTIVNKRINTSINKDLIIALGGIFFQVILLLFSLIFKNNINLYNYNLLIFYNYLLIIFNLLPIIPLDGSKITNLLLEKNLSYNLSYYANLVISFITLVLFVIINYVYNFDNYFICLFLLAQLFITIKNYKYLYHRFLLERYLYEFDYKKIDNNLKDLKGIKKEVYHYKKVNNHYISENNIIKNLFDK